MVILYIVIFLLGVGLVLSAVNWRGVFNKVYGNNPLRAKVYIEIGESIEFVNGSYYGAAFNYAIYSYKFHGREYSVIVPDNYPYRYVVGRRKIRVIFGQSTAAPLGGVNASDIKMSGDTLNLVLRSRIGSELVRSVFGKAINYMVVLVGVAVIGIAGYYVYTNVIKPSMPSENVTQVQKTQSIEDVLKQQGVVIE